MKKLLACIMAFAMTATLLTACGGGQQSPSADNDKLKIVATTFPQYDWIRQILGDNLDDVELTLLVGNGVDLHSYQPSVSDVAKMSSCDLFVYVGGPSDEWVEDALKSATNKEMVVVNLVETLGDWVKKEERKEGMQESHEHEGTALEADEVDEHVWLSLRNAEICVDALNRELGALDEKNADTYTKNTASYLAKLNDLDLEYQKVVDTASNDTLVFADRFPFRYLVDDYELDYFAAFAGCSAETEASFETVIFLANKVDELNLQTVIAIEGSDQSLAKTVIQNTKNKSQKIVVLDSMQSITADEINGGITYLSIMDMNLEALISALA